MIFPAFAPYIDKVAYEIYIAGCDRYCPACHNPELHDFSLGVKFNISDKASKKLLKNIKKAQELFDIIAILGGDLLCQDEHEARRFVIWLKNHFPQKKLWLFTGVNAEELPNWTKEMFDVIKVGRYVKKLHQEGFPASSNQKLLWRGVDY
jgi:anaerobic ribonucleoside-triphosphate reductase activating protein